MIDTEREQADAKIRAMGRKLKLTDDLVQGWIDEGLSYEEAFERAIGEVGSGVQIGQTSTEKSAAALEDAIEHRLCGDTLRHFAAKADDPGMRREISAKPIRLQGNPYAGKRLLEMVRDNYRAKGGRYTGRDYTSTRTYEVKPAVLASQFIDVCKAPTGPGIGSQEWREAGGLYQRNGAFIALQSDVPNALANVIRRVAFVAYKQNANEWEAFTKKVGVEDFRPKSFRRTGHLGTLATLKEGQEVPYMAIADSVNTDVQIDAHVGQMSVSRETLINDDLDLIRSQAEDAGRAQALTVQKAVFDLLALNGGLGPTMADSLPLFDAGHSNVSPAAALSKDTLDVDRAVLKGQVSPSNKLPLGLKPSVLLVPAALEGVAMDAAGMRFSADARAVDKVIASPWLTGTRRYTFVDPAQAAALVVAFLAGDDGVPIESPSIEMRDRWSYDALGYKIRLDFRVVAWEPLAAVTNAG